MYTHTHTTFYLSGAKLYEHFGKKLCWADTDCEFVKQIPIKIITYMQTWKGFLNFLFVYFLQLFAYFQELYFEKKFFDMVHGFDQQQVVNM